MRKSSTLCYRNGSFPGMGKHLFNQTALTLLWKQKLFPHMHHSRELSNADKQHDRRYFTATSAICPLDWIVFFNFKKMFFRKYYKRTEVSRVTGITSHLQVFPYTKKLLHHYRTSSILFFHFAELRVLIVCLLSSSQEEAPNMTDSRSSPSVENLEKCIGNNFFLLLVVQDSNANCWGW